MSGLSILYINITVYSLFTLYFFKRYGLKNLSTIASFAYLVSAIFSFLYYNTPVFLFSFSNIKDLKLGGMVWLALFNFLSCNLLRGFGLQKNCTIYGYDEVFFGKLQKLIIFLSIIILIFQLPSAVGNLLSRNLSDIREATYTDGAQVSSNFIVDIIQRIFGGLNIFLLILPAFKFFVLKKIGKIDVLSLIVYVLLFISTMGAYVSRAVIIYRLIDLLILFLLLKDYIKIKKLKYILLLIIPLAWGLSNTFSAITSSRFGTSSFNKAAEMAANLRYVGESQLNFMSIMYDETDGNTYGYKSLPLFRKLLGLDYYGKYGVDREANLAVIDKVHKYPNYIFYTAGGTLYLDWGKYLPIFFLIFINIYYYKFRHENNFQLLIWEHIISFFVFYGIFYASYQNEASNFLFLFLMIFWYKCGKKKMDLNN